MAGKLNIDLDSAKGVCVNELFEQELRKIIGQSTAAADASYVGRSCFVRLNPDLRAKLTFITMGIASHYEALKMTILNRKEGEVDNTVLRFSDLLGKSR